MSRLRILTLAGFLLSAGATFTAHAAVAVAAPAGKPEAAAVTAVPAPAPATTEVTRLPAENASEAQMRAQLEQVRALNAQLRQERAQLEQQLAQVQAEVTAEDRRLKQVAAEPAHLAPSATAADDGSARLYYLLAGVVAVGGLLSGAGYFYLARRRNAAGKA